VATRFYRWVRADVWERVLAESLDVAVFKLLRTRRSNSSLASRPNLRRRKERKRLDVSRTEKAARDMESQARWL
jgi:hypothetical protein